MKTSMILSAATILIAVLGAQAVAKPGNRDAQAFFERFDVNGDGQITREEISVVRAERLTEVDADGDGFVTADELEAAAAERARERVARIIELRDADGDGKLSLEEMEPGERASARFNRVDQDRDGIISQAEFDAARADRKPRGAGRD